MKKTSRRKDYRALHETKLKESFSKSESNYEAPKKLLKFDSKAEKHVLKVRFLPNKNPDDFPFSQIKSHNIYIGPDTYHFITCGQSTSGTCPICEFNRGLDDETVKKSRLYATKKYYSNVLVISDSVNPDNNGKVMVLEYSQTTQNFLMEMLKGDEEMDEKPSYYYDLEHGSTIVIKKEGIRINTKYIMKALKPEALDEDLDDMIFAEIEDTKKFGLQLNKIASNDEKMLQDYKHFLETADII